LVYPFPFLKWLRQDSVFHIHTVYKMHGPFSPSFFLPL
jgi:hypothetical protein